MSIMGAIGSPDNRAYQEIMVVKCGDVSIGAGQVLRWATSSDTTTMGATWTVWTDEYTTSPDGATVMMCDGLKIPCGIALEGAGPGEVLKMLIYGYCTSVTCVGTVEENEALHTQAEAVGAVTGTPPDALTGEEYVFGVALEDSVAGVIGAAWVNFK